jgi:hypothetical protein
VDGSKVSTVGLNESRFALLTGPAGDYWFEAARKVAAARGMELRAVRLSEQSATSVNLHNDGAILVRPDGFIAWRASGIADADVLDKALASITGR